MVLASVISIHLIPKKIPTRANNPWVSSNEMGLSSENTGVTLNLTGKHIKRWRM